MARSERRAAEREAVPPRHAGVRGRSLTAFKPLRRGEAWGARLAGLRAILAVERSRRHRPNALTARAYAV